MTIKLTRTVPVSPWMERWSYPSWPIRHHPSKNPPGTASCKPCCQSHDHLMGWCHHSLNLMHQLRKKDTNKILHQTRILCQAIVQSFKKKSYNLQNCRITEKHLYSCNQVFYLSVHDQSGTWTVKTKILKKNIASEMPIPHSPGIIFNTMRYTGSEKYKDWDTFRENSLSNVKVQIMLK